MTGPMSGCASRSVGPTLIARAASTSDGKMRFRRRADRDRRRAGHATFARAAERGRR